MVRQCGLVLHSPRCVDVKGVRASVCAVHVMDGLAFGFHGKGRAMKLFDVKTLFNGPVMGNCGYTPQVPRLFGMVLR